MASVGFSFTMTQFFVILYLVGAIAVGIHAYSEYKSRRPPPGLSKRGSRVWRLAPTIGLGSGLVVSTIVIGTYVIIKNPRHADMWTSSVPIFVTIVIGMATRRTVERRAR